MKRIEFMDENGTFKIQEPEQNFGLYLPLAGEQGLKSSVTPTFGGDSKIDQNHFLLEPVTMQSLQNNRNTRNFWCRTKDGLWSACGNSAEQESLRFSNKKDVCALEAGFMWQKTTRESQKYQLKSEITMFVPINGQVEIMLVELTNMSNEPKEVLPVAAIPIYARSADNVRDHRHVTSLLHRIETRKEGVVVTPTLSFDERGHQKNDTTYFVCGSTQDGGNPQYFFPTEEEFLGEYGTYLNPQAVFCETKGRQAGTKIEGKEALGGICFPKISLNQKESASYIIVSGITNDKSNIDDILEQYKTLDQIKKELLYLRQYWNQKVNVQFQTKDDRTDHYLKWICFQPILRRIYGCSFLPHHDYGKGGRGWRDLWQDCLALLIMDPSPVRQMILDNFAGVRMDGTNATIIGQQQGEFIADRNHITRVWMDHAFWPFVTTKFYIDQTGDFGVLFEKASYFKDMQSRRGTSHDMTWNLQKGNRQRTKDDVIYKGSILEHILIENLSAFYDVGDHNQIRLHGADWNDALDMAWEKGESVAFTCAYAGNLYDIAQILKHLQIHDSINQIDLAQELQVLLVKNDSLYESVEKKQEILEQYLSMCESDVCGRTVAVDIASLIENLEEKAKWLMDHIKTNEWVTDGKDHGWFNGYYDNHGRSVEGMIDQNVRMMLTSQVFAIMSATATKEQIAMICKSADTYLFDEKAGGYKLNTNFKEEKFDLGRMFGFAYGEKENGAVFSHMSVMYANALYKQGFVSEGYKVLNTLLETAKTFDTSKMYPGIPEYFDHKGRGLYSYLTGAASWFMVTMVTQVFGVHGEFGNLILEPKLLVEQFDEQTTALISLFFAEHQFNISYINKNKKTYGEYQIDHAFCDGKSISNVTDAKVILDKEEIDSLDSKKIHEIFVYMK